MNRGQKMCGAIGVAAAALAAAVLAPMALAHSGNSDSSVVHACVRSGTGEVRIVSPTGSCPLLGGPWQALHWGITGPTGPSGPSGPAGPQGTTGATGATGPSGASGPQGATGTSGATGGSGPQGATGATGASGPSGLQGPSGTSGPQGTSGTSGAAGPSGTSGPSGAAGSSGPSGPAGSGGAGGYLRVTDGASASNETSPKTDTVDCTGGRKAVGGGYVVTVASGSAAEITVTANRATDDDTWSVTGAEDNDDDVGNWAIEAYVVCVTASA